MTEDPKALWQHQDPRAVEMDFDRLRAKMRADQSREQRDRWSLILVTLIGVSLTVYLAYSAPSELLRFGQVLSAGGFIVFFALGWRRMRRPPLDTTEACLAFLRRRLVRRRDAARGGWIGLAAPLFPGLAVTSTALAIASGKHWSQLAPIAALLLLWIVTMLIIQAREAAMVDAEIAELDRLSGA